MGEERRRAEEFARRLAQVYGDELVSVVLYGSAARGDFRPGKSDLNLLVLLRTVDPATLRRGSTLAREWAEAGNPPPLMFGREAWRDSADVFPIEYSDIQDAHLVLHGLDPFAGVEIHWRYLRLQCEHQLKEKLIQLRERYLLSADRPEELGALLVRSLSTFLVLFRSALRVAGAEVPREPARVIDAVAGQVGFDAAALHEVLRAREQGSAFAPAGDGPVVTGYLDAVERTTVWLDRLTEPGAGTP